MSRYLFALLARRWTSKKGCPPHRNCGSSRVFRPFRLGNRVDIEKRCPPQAICGPSRGFRSRFGGLVDIGGHFSTLRARVTAGSLNKHKGHENIHQCPPSIQKTTCLAGEMTGWTSLCDVHHPAQGQTRNVPGGVANA